ncbi:hypothetical protein [Halobacillus seohaensis]|uniref:Uncharacterized protein n=1 Tax=Halobacillus seohaensis TaxID=447421 RepID=A0ABW2EGM9_9BACI
MIFGGVEPVMAIKYHLLFHLAYFLLYP